MSICSNVIFSGKSAGSSTVNMLTYAVLLLIVVVLFEI
jgi:hypothetical protein